MERGMSFPNTNELRVAFNNTNIESAAMKTQQCLFFNTVKECYVAVNMNVLQSSCKSARYFCQILTKFSFSLQILIKSLQYQISRKCVQWQEG
jgi:hypothetical protein